MSASPQLVSSTSAGSTGASRPDTARHPTPTTLVATAPAASAAAVPRSRHPIVPMCATPLLARIPPPVRTPLPWRGSKVTFHNDRGAPHSAESAVHAADPPNLLRLAPAKGVGLHLRCGFAYAVCAGAPPPGTQKDLNPGDHHEHHLARHGQHHPPYRPRHPAADPVAHHRPAHLRLHRRRLRRGVLGVVPALPGPEHRARGRLPAATGPHQRSVADGRRG